VDRTEWEEHINRIERWAYAVGFYESALRRAEGALRRMGQEEEAQRIADALGSMDSKLKGEK